VTAPLADWQRAVAATILNPSSVRADDRPAMPDTAAGRAGWPVTIALYRQWRVFRLLSLAPLTIALLGPRSEPVIDGYFAAAPGSTSYAARDAVGFLRYLRANYDLDPRQEQMSDLELAFLAARRPAAVDSEPAPGTLVRSRRASLLAVRFDVLSLIRWAAGTGPQPDPAAGVVLVAPALDGWVRPADVEEYQLWQQLVDPVAAEPIRRRFPVALADLQSAGAILH
jgi:hypothetical protein